MLRINFNSYIYTILKRFSNILKLFWGKFKFEGLTFHSTSSSSRHKKTASTHIKYYTSRRIKWQTEA